jgi:hypothetical protein
MCFQPRELQPDQLHDGRTPSFLAGTNTVCTGDWVAAGQQSNRAPCDIDTEMHAHPPRAASPARAPARLRRADGSDAMLPADQVHTFGERTIT